jgi:hypothetical protein
MISFRRPVSHGEQAAILCDSWFHNLRFTQLPGGVGRRPLLR